MTPLSRPLQNRPSTRRWRGGLAALGTAAGVLASLLVPALGAGAVDVPAIAPTAVAAAPEPDGSTQERAAASCWEIKQNDSSSADGVYWLVTPELVAPEQFYCDQTTDGGGWVLIGRGREGWRQNYEGTGTTAQVRDVVTGPDAFDPRHLDSSVVDALLGGGRVDALTDGIRLRRATNTQGTSWQESRFTFLNRDRWVWTFAAEHRVGRYSFNGTADSASGGQTSNFGRDNGLRRVTTQDTAAQSWRAGFAFGPSVTGTTSATSYLWSASNGLGAARPFTQVFLRPQLRLADLDFPAMTDSGLPVGELEPLVNSGALNQDWGVTGLANGRSGELDSEVSAFTQIGGTMFVGGNFRYVQRGSGATGSDRVEQSYLAAFDVASGEWIRNFRPVLNGQVKSLTSAGGRLIVGGQFVTVNGTTAPALAAIDPDTGALDPSWKVTLENRLSSGVLGVRTVTADDDWVYVGGAFTHAVGGTVTTPVYARSALRVSVADGSPDRSWSPEFNGTVVSMDTDPDAGRVYAAGYFTQSRTSTANKSAALGTGAGAPLATPSWTVEYSADDRSNYQQAVLAAGDRIWLGGSEHSLFSFDPQSFDRLSGNITKNGGDFQALGELDGVVYGGCHCENWNYSEAYTWSNVGTSWTQADKVGFVAGWDAATGDIQPEFNPVLRARKSEGTWAIAPDSEGNLWVGGTFTSGLTESGRNQWVGGFLRFASRDTTAPQAPSSPQTQRAADGTTEITWTASDSSGVRYEVVRNGRVVAVTGGVSATLNDARPGDLLAVRAVDSTGNRSATTAAAEVPETPAEPVVASGSEWSWFYGSGAVGSDWASVGFDDSSWSRGAAVLGFGSAGVVTSVDVASGVQRPLASYFRHSFEVDDVDDVSGLQLSTRADDGVVVYVNGVEVGRSNMPSGPVSAGTYAVSARRTATAVASPVVFEVPASVLRDGENVVAAQVHLNYRSTADISFDLEATETEVDVQAPSRPSVQASSQGASSVGFAWEADATPGLRYRFARSGADPVEVSAAAGEAVVDGLDPGTSYTWAVTAVDRFGVSSAERTVGAETSAEPVVASGSEWSWFYGSGAVGSDWASVGFDDSSWSRGAAVLGFGSAGVVTSVDVASGVQRPLASYFRHSFEVDDVDDVSGLQLSTRADDGVVVYVNGVEVGRSNMPSGPVSAGTYAVSARRTATAVASPVVFEVPASVLRDGENVVAAQVHLNYRSTADISFDLEATETE